tara:strand:- start:239 stop:583 length:345 start_codon:yes stop_codon:yes gene_type:complete
MFPFKDRFRISGSIASGQTNIYTATEDLLVMSNDMIVNTGGTVTIQALIGPDFANNVFSTGAKVIISAANNSNLPGRGRTNLVSKNIVYMRAGDFIQISSTATGSYFLDFVVLG